MDVETREFVRLQNGASVETYGEEFFRVVGVSGTAVVLSPAAAVQVAMFILGRAQVKWDNPRMAEVPHGAVAEVCGCRKGRKS